MADVTILQIPESVNLQSTDIVLLTTPGGQTYRTTLEVVGSYTVPESVTAHVNDASIHVPSGGLSHTLLVDIGTMSHDALEAVLLGVLDDITGHLASTGMHSGCEPYIQVVTFVNGWQDAGAYTRYARDNSGFVHLEVGITGGTWGAEAFELPLFYRPDRGLNFSGCCAGGVACRVNVSSAGVVSVYGGSGWCWLGGATYRAVIPG